MSDASIVLLETKLGITFNNKLLLQTAMTHSSYAKRRKNHHIEDNERLEFFGDAVLKLTVSEYLFFQFPHYQEGKLTKLRAYLISDKLLAEYARTLDFDQFLKVSTSERKLGGQHKHSLLSNAFEAVLGAIYLDQGLGAVKIFLTPILEAYSKQLTDERLQLKDPKTYLQELTQKDKSPLPIYTLESTSGPEHNKIFHVSLSVTLKNHPIQCEGTGQNKKEAEQTAAELAIQRLEDEGIL